MKLHFFIFVLAMTVGRSDTLRAEEVCGLFGNIDERINDCQRLTPLEAVTSDYWTLVSQFEVVVDGEIKLRKAYLDEIHEAVWVKAHSTTGRDLAEHLCYHSETAAFRSLIGLNDAELSGRFGADSIDWTLPTISDVMTYSFDRPEPFGILKKNSDKRFDAISSNKFWIADDKSGYPAYVHRSKTSVGIYTGEKANNRDTVCVGHVVTDEFLKRVEGHTGFHVLAQAQTDTYRPQLNEFLIAFNHFKEERRNAFRSRIGKLTLSLKRSSESRIQVSLAFDRIAGTLEVELEYRVHLGRRFVLPHDEILPILNEALIEVRRIAPTVSVPKAPEDVEFDG